MHKIDNIVLGMRLNSTSISAIIRMFAEAGNFLTIHRSDLGQHLVRLEPKCNLIEVPDVLRAPSTTALTTVRRETSRVRNKWEHDERKSRPVSERKRSLHLIDALRPKQQQNPDLLVQLQAERDRTELAETARIWIERELASIRGSAIWRVRRYLRSVKETRRWARSDPAWSNSR